MTAPTASRGRFPYRGRAVEQVWRDERRQMRTNIMQFAHSAAPTAPVTAAGETSPLNPAVDTSQVRA